MKTARTAVDPTLGAQIVGLPVARETAAERDRDEAERQHDPPEDGEAQPGLEETPRLLELTRHATAWDPRRGRF